MAVSAKMRRSLEGSSWIRRMFEAGAELAAKHGPGKVCDFSLGNPDVEPPARLPGGPRGGRPRSRRPHKHGYMPNAGYPEVRAAVAAHLSAELRRESVGRRRRDELRGCRRAERGAEGPARTRATR